MTPNLAIKAPAWALPISPLSIPLGVREVPADARPELVAFLAAVEIEEDGQEEDYPPREEDFRTGRAQAWAEYLAEAVDFARRMRSGDIGWPP